MFRYHHAAQRLLWYVRGVVAGESGRLRGRGRDAPLRMLEDGRQGGHSIFVLFYTGNRKKDFSNRLKRLCFQRFSSG